MKAAVFKAAGQPLAIETVDDPTPGPTDLVLKVKRCGICGSDLHASEPGSQGLVRCGTVMGHEFSGEVVAVGSAVRDTWKTGDRVAAVPFIGCGSCELCARGESIWCRKGAGHGFGKVHGGYAEYIRVGAQESVRLPENVDYAQGALVEPLAVGLHGVRLAQLKPGASVLVMGAGPVGLATALWARALGARHVVVWARSNQREALAATLGATAFIAGDADVRGAFKAAAGGPPDAIFECVGAPGTIDSCIKLAPARGQIVVLGVCMKPDTFTPNLAVNKELRLQFALAYAQDDFHSSVDLLSRRSIPAEAMVTDTVGFGAFPAAFEALRQRTHQCKVLLNPELA
ncbi:zinc-binding dehydrogenase [Zavarzinia sp. CC-PAN008]|uniref:zinc-binding dehydrogenase n=1 Tax=Zavarzinia sp. CC-PAN008 TaxID=3243332 RepID=UPI003F74A68B